MVWHLSNDVQIFILQIKYIDENGKDSSSKSCVYTQFFELEFITMFVGKKIYYAHRHETT